MVKPLTVYKASAGSGKTFALAVQYIKLVVQNPQAYRNILAVTFTNKATEEMKTRILSQLYGIWKQLPDSESYTRAVCRGLDASPAFVSERAGQALSLLLHNYNHFRVMTIDTFFQSVLRNLARELDLTANLRVGLNDTQVEELAVDRLIGDLNTTDVMLQWILKYIMENISDDKSWNVIGQIKQFGKTIFRDYYKDISKQLNEKLQEEGFFNHYTRTLRNVRQAAQERMVQLGQEFFDTLEQEGLTVDDLSNKRRGIASFFYKLQDGIFDESIENLTVANCLGDPTRWYTKTHPRRELIHALADGQLGGLLRRAVEERPRQWRLYQSATLTLRHLNQVRLLSSIENKVRELNDEANRFLLSDTQKLLNVLISDSDSPFIFEKIGTQLEHVMIDEFQDTSTVQWQNFRVLLLETMSHQGSQNLIVGDVKQSIYRWRAGDWRLLNNIEQQFDPDMIQTEVLKTNRRSARNVVLFNNAFFAKAAQLEYDAISDQPDADQLKRAYQDVEQEIPADKPADGYVSLQLLPADDYQQQTLNYIADAIDRLSQHGIAHDQIAILVRTNSLIPLIANYFAEHRPDIHIVSDEAFRLDASLPVNIIIQALRLIKKPDDQLARAFLMKTGANDLTAFDDRRLTTYNKLALYELVERLFADFQLDSFDDQSAYVCAFFDQLRQYTADNPATIDGFLREWENDLCSKTIRSDVSGGVRIISIHKSKGLEFDHVICPFCDWQLEKTGNILWCHPGEAPFDELPLAPIDYSQKGMTGTIYEADYQQEHLQNVVDNLNLLYVAFTRARNSLFVCGRRSARNSRSEIIEQVLASWSDGSLEDYTLDGTDDDTRPLTFEYGHLSPAALHESPAVLQESPNPFLQPSAPYPVSIRTYQSHTEFRQSNQSRDFVSSTDDEPADTNYIQLGSILHRIFSTIRTAADIDDALRQLEQEGVLYDQDITLERITAMLRKRLSDSRVADWFSPRWTLFNECTILSVEQGSVVERRPDRVMTDGTQWVVVDFKFGRPREEYHRQVQEYMQLLQRMGHTDVKGFLWYVYSNKIEEV
ncbi:MAG: UvrD-helicase domain-containing protein [Prevotella sp.]|nr:UvrD-helicase domain-containing protein [Prevotella sp.]